MEEGPEGRDTASRGERPRVDQYREPLCEEPLYIYHEWLFAQYKGAALAERYARAVFASAVRQRRHWWRAARDFRRFYREHYGKDYEVPSHRKIVNDLKRGSALYHDFRMPRVPEDFIDTRPNEGMMVKGKNFPTVEGQPSPFGPPQDPGGSSRGAARKRKGRQSR